MKSYQHVANRVRQRRRLIESEKAAEELLRLNVKHGVVDLDGQVIKPSQNGQPAGTASGTGKDVADGKRRARSGTLEKESKSRPSDSNNLLVSKSTSEKSQLKPVPEAPTAPRSVDGNDLSHDDDQDEPNKVAKSEAKKAKKKIKRAARLEQRKNSGDLVTVASREEGADLGSDEQQDARADDEAEAEAVVKGDDVDEAKPSVTGQVIEDVLSNEAGPEDEAGSMQLVEESGEQDKAESLRSVKASGEQDTTPTPVEPLAAVPGREKDDVEPKEVPAEDQGSPVPFIHNMPSIEIQHVALPDSPPPSRLRRRASEVSDSAASLLSGASSGLSGNPNLQQNLEQYHLSGVSTPSDQPQQKRKKKAKPAGKPQRAIPGAENWVKESHEEKEREVKEQLEKQVEEARAASSSATARASKAEKENESLTTRLHKLESKLSKVTSSQHDLREREKTAVWEKEEAVKRANEAQTVMQNCRKVEAALKHDVLQARKERDKLWQDSQRKEADVSCCSSLVSLFSSSSDL